MFLARLSPCACFIIAASCLSLVLMAMEPLMRVLQVPFTVELMNSMVQKSKTYVLLDTKDVLIYLMPTVPSVRAILSPDAIQHADDDKPADSSSRDARSLVLVIIDLRIQRPPQQQPHHLHHQHYQMPGEPAAAHVGWNGGAQMPPMHPAQQLPAPVHSYTLGDSR